MDFIEVIITAIPSFFQDLIEVVITATPDFTGGLPDIMVLSGFALVLWMGGEILA